jgi:hypothetical protein
MQMKHFLSAALAAIDDGAETVFQPLLARQSGRQQQHPAQKGRMIFSSIEQRGHVQLWNKHEMYRGDRVDVVKCQYIRVLVHFLARYLAARNLAE